MSERGKSEKLTALAEILGHALPTRLKPGVQEAQVKQAWEVTAPAPLRANLRFVSFRAGAVRLEPTSSAWAQEVRMRREELISRINDHLKQALVSDLHCGGPGRKRRGAVK
jgi:hypothetical protein